MIRALTMTGSIFMGSSGCLKNNLTKVSFFPSHEVVASGSLVSANSYCIDEYEELKNFLTAIR